MEGDEREKLDRDERQRQLLDFAERLWRDGITPDDLERELDIRKSYAVVLLSRLKGKGIFLKKESKDGKYYLTSKGQRKLDWLRVKDEENKEEQSKG